MTPVLKELLITIRQHDGYRELLAAVAKPKIRPFQKSKAEHAERARAEWIYESGQMAQHEQWLSFLSGTVPQDGEITEETND